MPRLLSAKALAHVFPEGQKITGFSLEYDCELDPEGVSATAFAIADRFLEPTIPAEQIPVLRATVRSRRVTLQIDPAARAAWAIMNYTHDGRPNPYGPPLNVPGGGPRPSGPPPKGGPDPKKMGYTGPKPLQIELEQTAPLRTAGGQIVPPGRPALCTELSCPETERFLQRRFGDLTYNLYIPEHYDASLRYPLVLFVPDASARGTDPTIPLRQGIGGVVWASPEDQAKHPCFVVCPAFAPEEVLTHDDFTCLPRLYQIKDLLDALADEFSIDPDRIYTTGQSMGCMTSCELMCAFPAYFAGAVLVAGQWDPDRCGKAMAGQNLWILVSENDVKAHPGMDAVTAAIETNGGAVARSRVDGAADEETLNHLFQNALRVNANVRYTLFEGDSVVPPGEDTNPGSNHICTWWTAYRIPAVRDWLFTMKRSAVPTLRKE